MGKHPLQNFTKTPVYMQYELQPVGPTHKQAARQIGNNHRKIKVKLGTTSDGFIVMLSIFNDRKYQNEIFQDKIYKSNMPAKTY